MTADNKFEEYHRRNPQVYAAFKKYALQAASRRNRFSARAVFHRMRWQSMVRGDDQYKINNNYSAYYVRMFEKDYPDLVGFFETRKRRD